MLHANAQKNLTGTLRLQRINPAHKGFTLIELLVVISIISLLAAILFPVFARARESARRASCLSNLKQIGLGMMMYVQDYDEAYPTTATSDIAIDGSSYEGFWVVRIFPYVKNGQVFQCPNSPSTIKEYNIPYAGGKISLPDMNDHNYGMNQNVITFVAWGNPMTKVTKMSEIGSPSRLPLIFDCTMGITLLPTRIINADDPNIYTDEPANPAYARHINGSNILFSDGHAKFLQQAQMVKDPSRVSLGWQYWNGIPMYLDDDRVR